MASLEAQHLGTRLDADHSPETNGRMGICRRCGVCTDGPEGKHTPRDRQTARTNEWLDAQSRISRLAGVRDRINR